MSSFIEYVHRFFFCGLLFLTAINQALCAPGDNVALASQGGVATQSSFWRAAWPASNCINGITASNRNAQLCHTKRNPDPNEWWDVQLPATVPIDEIVIHNRTNCCSSRILGIYVLVSDSPFPSGTDAASLNAARAQADFEYLITSNVTVTTITVGHLPGRYVRLQKSGTAVDVTSTINLLEIEVFEGEGIDLRMTKSASDSSPNIGDLITFTLTLTNFGPAEATNFTVSDLVPAGFGGVSNISHGGVLGAASAIGWQIASLQSGSSMALTFQAVVLPP